MMSEKYVFLKYGGYKLLSVMIRLILDVEVSQDFWSFPGDYDLSYSKVWMPMA